ncbi:phospholipid/cholesterol/gamma-HCH transport system substrate-binding protein [Tamaricihabitans halophyticus]|uniref:Phospholipid/cholesterol/gamma-HCH transport system substrate-binding protein n=1 Tax=Tamaricihabitans halophyticus TaxID=1262583 RepID=A0A4R2Q938_9PSEU|nr:MCE family protein [Tamaricihabitans halophyticus]TCP45392.1 phospholipid/cholesterol/gamma-HCH transport system substrate-binding protein [Tamaricihabitans halophyticus]
MLLRRVKVQLVVFVVIAVVGVGYVGGQYAGLDRLFGSRGYVVSVQLSESGGIFTNAEVTYRGVPVGRVGELALTDTGLEVELEIEDSAPPIPADTRAVVANRSAIGEQYVDLQPEHQRGPYLADGSEVPAQRTSTPIRPDDLLANLNSLVASVPTESLRVSVDELDKAFRDSGPALQNLLDSSSELTATATSYLPQTTALLSNGRDVLRTQRDLAEQITSYSSGLREISAQLKKSDPDLRALLDTAPGVAGQVDEVVRESGGDLGVVFANLLTTAKITESRTDSLETLLVALPLASATAPSANPDGTGHLGLVLNFFNPMPCTKGYEGTVQRPGNDTTPGELNRNAYCAEPPGSEIGVRGSQNAPHGK